MLFYSAIYVDNITSFFKRKYWFFQVFKEIHILVYEIKLKEPFTNEEFIYISLSIYNIYVYYIYYIYISSSLKQQIHNFKGKETPWAFQDFSSQSVNKATYSLQSVTKLFSFIGIKIIY